MSVPRTPDAPCSKCGTLGWPSRGAAGPRVCQPCRRAAPGYVARWKPSALPRPTLIFCANPACGVAIHDPKPQQKWCARQCRDRATPPTELTRARWARKNAQRRANRLDRGGAKWRKLRAQVLVEEPDCWVCIDPIDPALRWPHQMSGTGDHVVPLEAGGALLDRQNVRAAHLRCNRERHVAWRRAQRSAPRSAPRAA